MYIFGIKQNQWKKRLGLQLISRIIEKNDMPTVGQRGGGGGRGRDKIAIIYFEKMFNLSQTKCNFFY